MPKGIYVRKSKGTYRNQSPEKRFWLKIDKKAPNECWEWKAGCFKNGYGAFGYNGKVVKAHRLAWELTYGPIPEGMFVLHHCDNPKCCNAKNTKDHLYLGTQLDNMQDRDNKGRASRISKNNGENHGRAKLTKEQTNEIRRLRNEGYKQQKLADMFGVSRRNIRSILNNKIWR